MTREQPSLRATLAALRSLMAPVPYPLRAPSAQETPYAVSTRGGIEPKADIWLAENKDPAPSALLVHGGGFVIGSRSMKPIRLIADHLVRAGISVCAPDYRMVMRGGGFRAGRLDVADAFNWWRGQCSRFNLDPARINILGLCAGAALSWAAADLWTAPPSRFISIYGAYDLNWKHGPARWLLKPLLFRRDPQGPVSWSPINCVELPCPVLMIHGDKDSLVPLEAAQVLYERRLAKNLVTQLKVFPGQEHGFLNDVQNVHAQHALALITSSVQTVP